MVLTQYYNNKIVLKYIWNIKLFSVKLHFLVSTENFFLKYSSIFYKKLTFFYQALMQLTLIFFNIKKIKYAFCFLGSSYIFNNLKLKNKKSNLIFFFNINKTHISNLFFTFFYNILQLNNTPLFIFILNNFFLQANINKQLIPTIGISSSNLADYSFFFKSNTFLSSYFFFKYYIYFCYTKFKW